MIKAIGSISVAAIASAAFSVPAWAEATAEAGQGAATAESQGASAVDGEIVVMAQRQSQNLKDVPISVTAIDQPTLTEFHLTSIANIPTVTPGLVFNQGNSFPQTYIRGIGAPTVTAGLEQPVALYVDGAYVSRTVGTLLDLVDVGSIEVLKGPQGTLYGRNATGGAILLKTMDPTNNLGASGMVEYGRFNHLLIDGVVNVPLTHTLAVRVAGRYMDEDGFVRNLTTGHDIRSQHNYDIRGKIKWSPWQDFSATLTAEHIYQRLRSPAAGRMVSTSPLCTACNAGADTTAGPFEVTEDYETFAVVKSDTLNLNLRYDVGNISIQNVIGYRKVDVPVTNDLDHSPLPIFDNQGGFGGKTYSEDLQISSSFGGVIDFIAGLQYVHDNGYTTSLFYGTRLNVAPTDPTAPFGYNNVKTDSFAAFAETYIRPIDKLTITLGGRYSRDVRVSSGAINAQAQHFFSGGVGPLSWTQSASYNRFTPRAVIAYDAGLVSLYASYTEGFKAGGFKTPAFAPLATPILPESIKSYEIGAKFVSSDRRVRANIAGFIYDDSNTQVQSINGATGISIFTNAANVHGAGVELDFNYKPNEWISFTGGGSYLDAHYANYLGAPVFAISSPTPPALPQYVTTRVDLSGVRVPRAPRWTAFLGANLNFPLGRDWEGKLNGVVHYSADYDFNPDAGGVSHADRQPGYAIVNLSGGVGPKSGRYEIGFYVDNLTNARYYELIVTSGFGVAQYPAKPRTIGVRIKAQY